MGETARLVARLERMLDRLEPLLPPEQRDPDWSAPAFRWVHGPRGGSLEAVHAPATPPLAALLGVERQKARLERNTRQFLQGLPANDALLWGARGTGKSSLVRALLGAYAAEGLRLVEVGRDHLLDLPAIADALRGRPERFILFCDDLSFAPDESGYRALKAALDGSVAGAGENMVVYATSNRRHLVPEPAEDNTQAHHVDGELHPGEAVEERISLSERFGLWLAFHPFGQDAYLEMVAGWLRHLGVAEDPAVHREEALRFALERGSRSGRVAWQFARARAGALGLGEG